MSFGDLSNMIEVAKMKDKKEVAATDLGIAKFAALAPKSHEGSRRLVNHLLDRFSNFYNEHITKDPTFIEQHDDTMPKPFEVDIKTLRMLAVNDFPDAQINIDVQFYGVKFDIYCDANVVGARALISAMYVEYQRELKKHLQHNPHAKWDD